MWKKIFAAGLFATVGSVLFFGAQDASAALFVQNYVSGDWVNIESHSARICADEDAGQDYSETPIIAEIRAANYLAQFTFDELSEWTCHSFDSLPDNAEVRYAVPVSKRNSLSIEHTFPMNSSLKTMTLQFGSIDDEEDGNYLWTAGTSAQGVAATSASVAFDANGGTGVMPVIAGAEVGSNVNLPKNTLTRAGYNFAGWNTKADGTGTPYADKAAVPIAEIGVVTLFAQWNGRAVLDDGQSINAKIKKMAGDGDSSSYSTNDYNIKAIKTASALPAGFDTSDSDHIISDSPSISPEPIYAWFDNADNDNDGENDGIIYVYTGASVIEGGSDMSFLFMRAMSLTDISALASWDMSGVMNMSNIFDLATALSDISALASWNTSNATNMSSLFSGARSLSDISPVANWNTSSATNMSNMFYQTSIVDTDILETGQRTGMDYISWDISNVTNIGWMFGNCESLVDISKLASWDVSSVATMSGLFGGATVLSNISAIAAWKTSSITNIRSMFAGTAITSAEALRTMQHDGKNYVSWDMSNVTDMSDLFHEAAALVDIAALATWNISNVKNIGQMFCAATSLSDISAIANWNTSHVKEMYGLFRKATSLSSIDPLMNWDTSSVENMRQLFYLNSAITDLSAIKYWNTSRVTQLGYAFSDTRITDVNALRTMQHEGKDYVSWDVSNVTDVICTFEDDYWLTDISALDSWNIQSGADMTRAFGGVPATTRPDWYHE